MAKLFYTLEETCTRLNKSEDDIRSMAQLGQLEEMRDGDSIMFKRQQVDLIAGDEVGGELDLDISDDGSSLGLDLSGSVPGVTAESSQDLPAGGSGYGLSDSGTGLGLGGSASGLDLGGSGSGFGFDLGDSGSAAGLRLGDSAAASGISAAFEGGEDDDSAETRVADAVDEELSLEAVGSGSGLLDLTRESDDTSLGAELLDEVWEDDESGEFDASESGLFESTSTTPVAVASEAPMSLPVAMTHQYDGKWSGTGVGLLLGSLIALIVICLMLVTSLLGVSPKLAGMITGDIMIWGGGFAAFAIVAGLVGMFIGKASE